MFESREAFGMTLNVSHNWTEKIFGYAGGKNRRGPVFVDGRAVGTAFAPFARLDGMSK